MFCVISPTLFPPVQEKDRDKKEKEKDAKEKDKKTINGHLFTAISSGQATQCSQCNKTFNNKECFHCSRKPFSLFLPSSLPGSLLGSLQLPFMLLSLFISLMHHLSSPYSILFSELNPAFVFLKSLFYSFTAFRYPNEPFRII